MIPNSLNGHYSYFSKLNQLYSVCLVRTNLSENKICGAIIKTSHRSPKGLKVHLYNVHSIDPNSNNSTFCNKSLNITNFTVKRSVKDRKNNSQHVGSLFQRDPID